MCVCLPELKIFYEFGMCAYVHDLWMAASAALRGAKGPCEQAFDNVFQAENCLVSCTYSTYTIRTRTSLLAEIERGNDSYKMYALSSLSPSVALNLWASVRGAFEIENITPCTRYPTAAVPRPTISKESQTKTTTTRKGGRKRNLTPGENQDKVLLFWKESSFFN